MITEQHKTSITLHGLMLDVFLGWPDSERAEAQRVAIDIHIRFATPPTACLTDNLADTYCYDALVETIRTMVTTKPFRLLEHLGYAIYQTIKEHMPTAQLGIDVKKQPPIRNLTGGVAFYFGD